MSSSRRAYERQMVKRADMEATSANLSSYVTSHNEMKANAASEPRIETMRRQKMQAAIRSDIRNDAELLQQEADAQAALRDREQEERLARAIDLVKRQELRKEKDIQRIREESEELRALEAKLKTAFMNKEREAQLAERQLIKQKMRLEESQIEHAMDEDRFAAVVAMQQSDAERRTHATKARVYLEEQMADKETLKAEAQEQFEREKQMIDAIVAKIRIQDEDEDAARRAKQLETQDYIKGFLKEKEQWRSDAIQQQKDEESTIERYAEEKRAQQDAWEASKAAAQFERDAAGEKIAQEQKARQHEEEYMEQLRADLVIEEREEAMRLKEKEMFERRVQERMDMMRANAQQQSLKMARAKAEDEQEASFRQQMLDKFAEDDRIEQMNAQKRRVKQAEHGREVQRLIEARRAEFEATKRAQLEQQEEEKLLLAAKKAIIEEERKKLLEQYAGELHGYLPAGTLMQESDLQYFPAEIRDEIASKLDESRGTQQFGLKQTIQSYTIY